MSWDSLARCLPHKPMPPLMAAAWTAAALVLATALRFAFDPWLGVHVPFILYLPMVLVVSVWCGRWPGLAVAVVSAVIGGVWFMRGGFVSGANPWALASFILTSGLMILIGGSLARALQDRARSEQRLLATENELQTVVTELGHRSKNGLMVVMAIVSQSAQGCETVEQCVALINDRLGAMGKAQDVALARGGGSIPLEDLIETVLAPFGLDRFDREGPRRALWLGSDAAGSIALVAHELATNAVKHGALKGPAGKVELTWDSDGRQTGWLAWRETGGPIVEGNGRKGFGSRLFQVALRNLGGGVDIEHGRAGVICTMTFPLEAPVTV